MSDAPYQLDIFNDYLPDDGARNSSLNEAGAIHEEVDSRQKQEIAQGLTGDLDHKGYSAFRTEPDEIADCCGQDRPEKKDKDIFRLADRRRQNQRLQSAIRWLEELWKYPEIVKRQPVLDFGLRELRLKIEGVLDRLDNETSTQGKQANGGMDA